MCDQCYKEAGCPKNDNWKVRAASWLIEQLYSCNCVGGYGHIVFDDWNVGDDSITWCLKNMDDGTHKDASPEEIMWARYALEAFMELTVDERSAALHIDPLAGHDEE